MESQAPVDLSKAIKLREVVFRFDGLSPVWVTRTLRTITPEHRDLQQISIHNTFRYSRRSVPVDAKQLAGEEGYEEWMDLDRALIQLWESRTVRTRLFNAGREGGKMRELRRGLLPEVTKRGIIELVDSAEPRWNRYL
jgi:hypothetical protein